MGGHGHGTKGHKRGKTQRVSWQDTKSDFGSNPVFFTTGIMNHGQSKTWKSGEAKERDHFSRINNLVHHLAPESPFTPQTYSQWVEHRAAMNEVEKEKLLKNIETMQARKSADARIQIKSIFGPEGKLFSDNRSAVLSRPTIWSAWYTPTDERPEAQWPGRSELQHEGGDRQASNVGRYLPLPRGPGNETVNWKARQMLQPHYGLDKGGPMSYEEPPAFEIVEENKKMNDDPGFLEEGVSYLGDSSTE